MRDNDTSKGSAFAPAKKDYDESKKINDLSASISVNSIRNNYRGTISLPGDDDFDACIGPLYNKDYAEKKPAIVFRPRGVSDVQKAVRFALKNDFPISVKCAGHSGAGSSSSDGGVLINLELMRSCIVNVEKRTLMVEGGCQLIDLDLELEERNLAVPIGTYPFTGIGGLSLHGGVGHLMKKLDHAACDCILEMTVVLADGSVVICNNNENCDLFWAMKGSGGNFGIVTSFLFKCFPIQEKVYGGFRVQPCIDLVALLNVNAELLVKEKDYSALIYMINPPDSPPKGLTGLHIMHFGSDQTKIDAQLKNVLVADAVPELGDLKSQTYHKANMATIVLPEPQASQYWRPFMTRKWTQEHSLICEKAFKYVRENPVIANDSELLIETWGRDAKAHSLTSSWNFDGFIFCFEVVIGWVGEDNKAEGMAHVKTITNLITEGGYWKTQRQMGMGYGNYSMTYDDDSEGLYVSDQLRLAAIKAKYDPTNTFSKGRFSEGNLAKRGGDAQKEQKQTGLD